MSATPLHAACPAWQRSGKCQAYRFEWETAVMWGLELWIMTFPHPARAVEQQQPRCVPALTPMCGHQHAKDVDQISIACAGDRPLVSPCA